MMPYSAVVLAAGKGTRMRSRLAKVLHPVAGRPMLEWVVAAARSAQCERIVVVAGHGAEQVRVGVTGGDLEWVEQREQLGTGHAVSQAWSAFDDRTILLVLSGDVPLVRTGTLTRLLEAAATGWGAMAVAEVEKPGSLGRVVTDGEGRLGRIVEALDANEEELAIGLINAGIYALPAPDIFEFLERIRPDNSKGELYLTDAVSLAVAEGRRVDLVHLPDSMEAQGVNTRADLVAAHRALLARKAAELMESGVTILDDRDVVIESRVTVGPDTVIHPGVSLLGDCVLGTGCTIQQGVWLKDSVVGDDVEILPYSVAEGARLGSRVRVGPFARLRPGSVLEEGSRVGNFVEVKNTILGTGAKAGHLTYLGDATIGAGANIGAGVITCNYDGVEKHRTTIGERAFIGSDTMLVAPVTVGDDAVTGAGSVVTKDVPSGSLAVARAVQRNIKGWAARKRDRKKKGA